MGHKRYILIMLIFVLYSSHTIMHTHTHIHTYIHTDFYTKGTELSLTLYFSYALHATLILRTHQHRFLLHLVGEVGRFVSKNS